MSDLSPDQFALGDKVRVRAWLERSRSGQSYNQKYWKREEFAAPMDAIVVGLRTLSEGNITFWDEGGYAYEATNHFKAALVAYSLRNRPVFVKLEDIEVCDE